MIQTFRENRILSQLYALVVNFCTHVWYCIVSVVFKHAEQKPVEVLHSDRLKQWENHVAWDNIVAKLLQHHENIQSVEVNESAQGL